ncbi:HAD family phosphatase [Salipiger sp. HF18]|uniref:HAD family hydrolase n=1 Tax=Salipiger sp. HF18 TaxID=2721557 RepID=UPI00142E077A|nr:HAD family phosphatase [Salipiger sp. HF18]NIY98292.1 HAD family phosphatase [Salipiger sp. HF18]
MIGPSGAATIAAIAFDIDGTLVDSELLHLDVLNEVCAETGVDLSGLDDDRFRGVHLADVWTALEPRRPADLSHQHWTDLIVARYCARAGELRPLAGMEELLAAARGAGVPMVCVSNSVRRIVDANIAALGIAGDIAFSVSFDDVPYGKPHPAPYVMAASRLGLAPAQVAAVEDSQTGAISASAAGLRVFGIATEHLAVPGAELTVARLDELITPILGVTAPDALPQPGDLTKEQ